MMRSSLSLLNVGVVAKWIDAKGFGFIKDSNTQKEYFVHFRSLNMGDKGHRGLNPGSEVQFDADDSDTRSQAVNVSAVGGGPLPAYDAEANGGGRNQFGNNNNNGGNGGYNRNYNNNGGNYRNNNNGGNFRNNNNNGGYNRNNNNNGGYRNNNNNNGGNNNNNNGSGFRGNSMSNGGDF